MAKKITEEAQEEIVIPDVSEQDVAQSPEVKGVSANAEAVPEKSGNTSREIPLGCIGYKFTIGEKTVQGFCDNTQAAKDIIIKGASKRNATVEFMPPEVRQIDLPAKYTRPFSTRNKGGCSTCN